MRRSTRQAYRAPRVSRCRPSLLAPAVKEHEDRSSQLFSGTEELLKFQFMSMSLSYFSSLNMLKNLRGMNSDTAQAAMSATASSAAAASAASGAANIPSLEGISLGGADDLASAARKRERERAQRARSAQEAKEDAQVRTRPLRASRGPKSLAAATDGPRCWCTGAVPRERARVDPRRCGPLAARHLAGPIRGGLPGGRRGRGLPAGASAGGLA